MDSEIEIKTEDCEEDPLSLSDIDLKYVYHEDVYMKEEPEFIIIKTEELINEISNSPDEPINFFSIGHEENSDQTNDSEQHPTDTDLDTPRRKIFKRNNEADEVKTNAFFQEFLELAKEKQIDSILTRHFFTVNELLNLSLHYMIVNFKYKKENIIEIKNFENFLKYMESLMTNDAMKEIEEKTRGGSNELRNEIRYGRVTDSKIFNASKSQKDSNFIDSLLSIRKERQVEQIDGIINEIDNKLKLNVEKSGVFLSKKYPMMAAAPDAISTDYVIKIKHSDNLRKYVKDGKIVLRYLCQLQMLAHFAKRKKAMLVIAPPDYERTKKLNIYILEYNSGFCKKLLRDAVKFWKEVVFDRLWDVV